MKIHMMTHLWSRKLCTMLIAICCFTIAFPSKSDATFTADYTNTYNSYVYYYNLWYYGYNYNTYVLGYTYPYYYMYYGGYLADYYTYYYANPAYMPYAQYYVTQSASSYSQQYAGFAQYYWNTY